MLPFALFLGFFTAVCRSDDLTRPDSWRIINGIPIPINKAPYQTTIEVIANHECGGVIIDRDIILTAAHCLKYNDIEPTSIISLVHQSPAFFRVRVGNDYKQIGGHLHKIKRWIIHKDYWKAGFGFDIAMIKLRVPLEFTPDIQPIEVATDEPNPGEMAIVTGFGTTMPLKYRAHPLVIKQPLMNVTLPVVDRKKCSEIIWKIQRRTITDSMICAGYLDGTIGDACQGDSGGPMVVNGKLVGLTSWGIGCGRQNIPGIYTNVAKFAKWIERVKRILHYLD